MEKVVASQTMYHIGINDVDLLRFMSQYHPSIFMLVHHFFHHHPVHKCSPSCGGAWSLGSWPRELGTLVDGLEPDTSAKNTDES